MAERPDFFGMLPDIALPLIGEMLYQITVGLEKLTGNGRRGLCEERGEELAHIRERLAVVEANAITVEDTRKHKEDVDLLRERVARVEVNTQSVEVDKLRGRVGTLEDFRAKNSDISERLDPIEKYITWLKGTITAFGIVHGVVLVLLAIAGGIIAARWK